MHRHHALVLTLTALAGLPTVAAQAGPGAFVVPPDSFINQHVDSVPQLTEQVTMDPVVRRRLARHFHTSGPAVVRYIQNNLVLKRITDARRYQVYCIARDGHEYLINSRLPVGTPVFVLRQTGRPILKLACGNPMVAALPEVSPYHETLGQPKLAGLPTTGTGTLTPSLKPNGPVVLTMVPSSGIPVAAPVSPYFGALPFHGGGSGLGYLLGAPILYGILHHNGGGNTPGTSTGTNNTGNNSGGTNGNNTGTGTNNTGTNSTGSTGNNTAGTTGNNTGTGNNNLGTTGNNTAGTTGSNTGTGTGVTPVPEPSAPAAFLIGGVGLAVLLSGAKRRNRRVKG